MKRIAYIAPIDYMRGSLSGRQDIRYTANDVEGYYTPDGEITPANDYQPKLIAHYRSDRNRRFFCVRTRSSINMTAPVRRTMALMGGAGAIYAAIVREKSSPIYIACMNDWKSNGLKGTTFRMHVMRILIDGLDDYDATITIGTANIINPWVSSETPNVVIPQAIIDKFNSVLSNS